MTVKADRDRLLNCKTQLMMRIRQVLSLEAGLDSTHSTADINPDSGRGDGSTHSNDRTDCGAFTEVDVGHNGHMGDPGERGNVAQLVQGLAFNFFDLSPQVGFDCCALQLRD